MNITCSLLVLSFVVCTILYHSVDFEWGIAEWGTR